MDCNGITRSYAFMSKVYLFIQFSMNGLNLISDIVSEYIVVIQLALFSFICLNRASS